MNTISDLLERKRELNCGIRVRTVLRGEYGITIGNPNENKIVVVSAFGVDEENNE